ncbi:MAG: DUF2971 domain-containing protein [Maricaulaceae bacterium]|nr:DUF2971 domain-containing protein [Maricaulaceae bacterium]
MKLYKFTKAEHAIDFIKHRRIKVSKVDELNDPFEYISCNLADSRFRKVMKNAIKDKRKEIGLISLTKSRKNPLMWAHYADSNRGVALGVTYTGNPRSLVKVNYINKRTNPEILVNHLYNNTIPTDEEFRWIVCSKFACWSYEEEYRVEVNLPPQNENGVNVGACHFLELNSIYIGYRCERSWREFQKVADEASKSGVWKSKVKINVVRPSFSSFDIVVQRNRSLWK